MRSMLLSILLLLPVSFVKAECHPIHHDISVETKIASADVLPNLFKSEGTIRYEFERMLSNVDQMFDLAEAPPNICGRRCQITKQPGMVFSSKPEKLLKSYRGSERCEERLRETVLKPLRYSNLVFEDLEHFLDWFEDFSQGHGREGKDLYRNCAGACSPQYLSVLSKNNSSYVADVSVVCGPARDKLDNDYLVSVAYRWSCY